MPHKPTVIIIGFGRFGPVLFNILKKYTYIFVIDTKKIQNPSIKQVDYNFIKKADWIFLAVPISKTEKIIKKISHLIKEKTVVVDVCSVKTLPTKWMKKHLPNSVQILGTHPMFGPDSIKAVGYKNQQFILTPIRIKQNSLSFFKKILNNYNFKIIQTTPQKHDQETAYSLGLVHFLGRALKKSQATQKELTTLGYERLLKINETVNNDTWQLFYDMHKYNPYAQKTRNKLINSLKILDNKIKKENNKC